VWKLAVPTKRSFLHPQFDLDVLSNQFRISDLSDDLPEKGDSINKELQYAIANFCYPSSWPSKVQQER